MKSRIKGRMASKIVRGRASNDAAACGSMRQYKALG